MKALKHFMGTVMLGLAILFSPTGNRAAAQTKFATPEAAAAALQQALKAGNQEKMQAIFGREWMKSSASGDPVADQHDREVVALAMEQSWRWGPHGADGKELIIGDEQWPFPVPLVKAGNEWQFDSKAGQEEVLARRIGRNELGVISICRDYVRAQKEYAESATRRQTGRSCLLNVFGVLPAARMACSGSRNARKRLSPFGELVAAAVEEGYDPNKPDASPFRGYRFHILTAQGPAAPGGKKSYLVNSEMTGGFALLAYPAKYASSGVMTFMVGPNGVVYQKDLGEDTTTSAPLAGGVQPRQVVGIRPNPLTCETQSNHETPPLSYPCAPHCWRRCPLPARARRMNGRLTCQFTDWPSGCRVNWASGPSPPTWTSAWKMF